jgi:protein disulfide-isomerase A6
MQAAKGLKGIVNIAAVDMTTQKEAGAAYGIKGFPTIKIFGENKKDPTDYKGGRNASAIMEEALNLVKIQAFKKAGLPLPNKEQ